MAQAKSKSKSKPTKKTSAAKKPAKPTVSHAKPKADFTVIRQAGIKAYNLAVAHRSAIEPRLASGLIDGLKADTDSLMDVVGTTVTTKQGAKAATLTQEAACDACWDLVSAMRNAVNKTKGLTPDVKKKYGVGGEANKHLVKHVQAAANTIIVRARANPDEARSCKILPRDVDDLEALSAALGAADDAQEQERAAAPQSTKARNQAANRVLDAIREISAAGEMEFAADASLRQQFAELGVASPPRKPKTSPPPAPGTH